MVNPITRGQTACMGALAALLAALAVAPSADAATYYACVAKKGGAIHLVGKRTKCRRSETKISFNSSGLNGRNGLNGNNGSAGKNGANGTNGTNGINSGEGPLASGKTEVGTYASWGIGGGYLGTSVTFRIPLGSGLDATHVHFLPKGSAPSAECPGSGESPAAASRNLCVYETGVGAATFGKIFPQSTGAGDGSDPYGFGIWFTTSGTGGAWEYGTWAVTG